MRRAVVSILSALLALVLGSCGGTRSGSTEVTATPNERSDSAEATATPNERDGSTEATATPNEDKARAMAENILTAYNSGDYDAFTRDLSFAMKFVIGEDEFRGFRDKNLPETGLFVKLVNVTPTGGEGDRQPSYDVQAEFEKRGTVLLTMRLSSDHNKVEGLEFKAQS